MAIHLSTLLAAFAATTLLTAGVADAQTSRKVQAARSHHPVVVAEISDATARPLTVQRRSFLDPGTASTPSLGQPEYIASQTTEHMPVYTSYNRAFFGESELPRGYELPYNPNQFPSNNVDFSPLWRGLD